MSKQQVTWLDVESLSCSVVLETEYILFKTAPADSSEIDSYSVWFELKSRHYLPEKQETPSPSDKMESNFASWWQTRQTEESRQHATKQT